ncbi:hypothetical protein TVAG_490420 [Trichomonas vaginalis G3]|uniref:Uncharacterized protein n=1 Tax=Trichomonas vaginalis (strain ATCC PRA-98 / G3) TaxID=412133 RepID=A2F0X9_TRIV3|nr:mutated in bladder cancer 1 family [Trichomonas vaginalis G3]EAY01454.1 hypothetical protein TVAG_490420 [Trichomonas vaginalis G3]KAI5519253.1 mutated in bladder cancer 1 family [Trichomonas vaginalis G3]|eukprot:XP_001330267.1 hypothetical protein [Trichomonas vaginalis G3]
MSKYRPVLRAPKVPKSNNIEDVLKFIQEQKEKPSEAAAAAKKLTKISNDVKNREKKATQVKAFMIEFRKVMKGAETGKQLCTSTLIDLSGTLPELPELLKFDASLQNKTNQDVMSCISYLERLQSLLTRDKNVPNNQMYKSIHDEFEQHLECLYLPEEYDQIVEIVEKTKLQPIEKQKIDLSGLNDEWKQSITDQIDAFNKIEDELKKKHRDWLVENGFNPDEQFGGWEDLEHQRFILTNCGEITVEFNNKSPEELIRHKKWYIKEQFLNKKIDALHQELKTRIAKMKLDAQEEERQKEEQRLKDEMVRQRVEAMNEEKSVLDERLKVEREEKRKRDLEKQEQEEIERQKKEEEERKQKQLYNEEKMQLKNRVNAEKERRKEIEDRIQRNREIEAERQKAELKERRKEMKVVVSGRRQIEEIRKRERQAKDRERYQQKLEQQKRLEMLAQQVRDEFGLDDLVADPEKPTKIMEIRRNAEKEEKPMFNPTSFASSVIEMDPRIRIENALREAGLMNSPYAQNVITQMSALRPAPGMESHIKF